MTYKVFDGTNSHKCETLKEALRLCNAGIKEAQEWCDPQWPDWVNDIRIKQGGKTIMVATEINVEGPDGDLDEYGCDEQGRDFSDVSFYCDYAMQPPRGKTDIAPHDQSQPEVRA